MISRTDAPRLCLLTAILAIAAIVPINAQTTSGTGGYIPNAVAPGTPAGSYVLNNLFSINYATGNLNFNLPLVTLDGRGEASASVGVAFDYARNIQDTYGNNNWCPTQGVQCHVYSEIPSWLGIPGATDSGVNHNAGWMEVKYADNVIRGTSSNAYAVTRIYFYRPDGTATELVDTNYYGQPVLTQCNLYGGEWSSACQNMTDRGPFFVSHDGSQLNFQSDAHIYDKVNFGYPQTFPVSGTLYFPDGTKYKIVNGAVATITDRNGNVVSFGQNSITDSSGRTVQVSTNWQDESHGATTISYAGFQGQPRVITVQYVPFSQTLAAGYSVENGRQLYPQLYAQLTPAAGTDTSDGPALSTITLADGASQYRLKRNSYGELARLELPTGGAYEFDWASTTPVSSSGVDLNQLSIFRGVTEIRDFADGHNLSGRHHITYSIPSVEPTQPGVLTSTTTVVDYDANNNPIRTTKHYFYKIAALYANDALGHNSWKDGLEYQTEIYAANGTLLKRTVNTWQQKGALPWPDQGNPWLGSVDTQQAYDPRLTQVDTTIDDGSVSRVTLGYDQFNNITERKEYDFGNGSPGPLLRDTLTDYVTDPAYDDIPVRLLRLPSQDKVYDGQSNLVRLTYYHYDENSLQDYPGVSIVGHDPNAGAIDFWRGNLTTKSSWISGQGTYATETFKYDIAGNLITATDGRGNATHYDYADGGNVYNNPTTITNALGQITQNGYDYYTRKITSSVDPNNISTKYSYNDLLDRLTQIRRAADVPQFESQTNIDYQTPTWTIVCNNKNATGDCDYQTQTVYDGFGRKAEDRTSLGSVSHYVATGYGYDALGRLNHVGNPQYVGGPGGEPTDEQGYRTTQYDALGRIQSVTTSDGSSTTTSYTGNTATVTDPHNRVRKYTYNALGQLTSVLEDPGGPLNYTTSYRYDALGDLTHVTQGGQTRSFTYDGLQRLLSSTQPESGTTSYQYDADSNLTWRKDARGEQTCYQYDSLNRLQKKVYYSGSIPDAQGGNCDGVPASSLLLPTVAYTYDSSTVPYSIGRLTQLTNIYGTTNYVAYDPLGRATASQENIAGLTYTFGYGYL